jgi:hypothetical protein
MIDWDADYLCRVGAETIDLSEGIDSVDDLRRRIEPWLSAIFQSEHLSLLVGSGLPMSVATCAHVSAANLADLPEFGELADVIAKRASASAELMGRGSANYEDYLRAAMELRDGLMILDDERAVVLGSSITSAIEGLLAAVLKGEQDFRDAVEGGSQESLRARLLLQAFILSFASRASSRERLNLFTLNYDRFVEYACEEIGLVVLDRFFGTMAPIMRATRLDLDMHYNPPGIRGEPRYLEGVLRLTKLHGSLDWVQEGARVRRAPIAFGAEEISERPGDEVVIYPNPMKAIETAFYPYSELFRDFSAAVCRPNSALVTFGYGFGDSHVNSSIADMLSIPSTHLVVISYDGADGRIRSFCERVNPAQLTLLVGKDFGSLEPMVERYLPKSAIDVISERRSRLMERRGGAADPASGAREATSEAERDE